MEKYLEFLNKHRKIIEDECNSKFGDYGDIIQADIIKIFNDKLSKLRVSEKLQTLNLKSVMMNYDGNLYLIAMWDDK